jgi:AhpC/TSA family
MRKTVSHALSACLLLLIFVQAFQGQETKAAPAPPALKVGDKAPDFKLQYFDGTGLKNVSLSDYHGKKNVILAFYIFAFTGG